VNDEDLSSTSLLSVLSALREAGAAVIHSSATTSTEQRAALAEVAGEFLFDIQAADQNHSVEEALKRVLPVAEKLRIDVAATGKGKADGDAFTD
jgi:pyruvate-formate lyase-activating enzyme